MNNICTTLYQFRKQEKNHFIHESKSRTRGRISQIQLRELFFNNIDSFLSRLGKNPYFPMDSLGKHKSFKLITVIYSHICLGFPYRKRLVFCRNLFSLCLFISARIWNNVYQVFDLCQFENWGIDNTMKIVGARIWFKVANALVQLTTRLSLLNGFVLNSLTKLVFLRNLFHNCLIMT